MKVDSGGVCQRRGQIREFAQFFAVFFQFFLQLGNFFLQFVELLNRDHAYSVTGFSHFFFRLILKFLEQVR